MTEEWGSFDLATPQLPSPPIPDPLTMDARRLLGRMCSRHGLNLQDAVRLLPLIERALLSPHNVRDRILTLVDHNLSQKASHRPTFVASGKADTVQGDLDEEIMFSVARVLHAWTPSSKLMELGRLLPNIFPPGFSLENLEQRDLEDDEAEL